VADSEQSRGDAGALAASYERLRATVLAGGAGGWRLGHAVLSARGMSAWMSAFDGLAAPVSGTTGTAMAAVASSSEGYERPTGWPVAAPPADQVVAVLTQMVLPLAA
jgi:hypothetical protein